MISVALMRDVYPVGFAIASAVLGGMVGSFRCESFWLSWFPPCFLA